MFIDECEKRKTNYESLLPDGLHPSDFAYDLMYELILKEIGLEDK